MILYSALRISISSLLTLGFASQKTLALTLLDFTAATLGLMMIALLIAYLPSMYNAFSRREAAVALLEVRAGKPPSAVEMLSRYQRIHGLDKLREQWQAWETWFTEVEEIPHLTVAAGILPLAALRPVVGDSSGDGAGCCRSDPLQR